MKPSKLFPFENRRSRNHRFVAYPVLLAILFPFMGCRHWKHVSPEQLSSEVNYIRVTDSGGDRMILRVLEFDYPFVSGYQAGLFGIRLSSEVIGINLRNMRCIEVRAVTWLGVAPLLVLAGSFGILVLVLVVAMI